MWRNSADNFGLISRSLHWAMAALILALLALGTKLASIQPGLATLWLYGLHKTMGLTALALVLVRLAWHHYSPPPAPLGPARALTNRLARATHAGIYALLLAIPLSGWIASAATGLDVVVFGQITLPRIAPVSETWEHLGFAAHSVLTKLLMALLVAHVAGAALRGLHRDGTFQRMIGKLPKA